MNGNNIQVVIGGGRGNCRSPICTWKYDWKWRGGRGIEVEFNTDDTAMEGGLTPSKRGSKKAHQEEILSYYWR